MRLAVASVEPLDHRNRSQPPWGHATSGIPLPWFRRRRRSEDRRLAVPPSSHLRVSDLRRGLGARHTETLCAWSASTTVDDTRLPRDPQPVARLAPFEGGQGFCGSAVADPASLVRERDECPQERGYLQEDFNEWSWSVDDPSTCSTRRALHRRGSPVPDSMSSIKSSRWSRRSKRAPASQPKNSSLSSLPDPHAEPDHWYPSPPTPCTASRSPQPPAGSPG